MNQRLKMRELDSLNIIRSYLRDCKFLMSVSAKGNYGDCIVSISEALHKVQKLLKQHDFVVPEEAMKTDSLTNMISLEALKQGMIIHFDQRKGSN